MDRERRRFARGLSRVMHSMDPMDVMCLCRGVPRSQLAEGECDMDDCISRHVLDGKPLRSDSDDGTEEIEKYALYQT